MNTPVIIFDFDGTIADTKEAVIAIINRLAPEFGFSPLSESEIARYENLTTREILKQSRVSWWKLPFLIQRVKQELKQEIPNIQPISGIEETLEALKSHQFQLGIITSNSEENAIQFLRQHGLLHYFNFVESSFHLLGKHKVIQRLLRQKKFSSQVAIYVGDETRDIEAARKSGVRMIAVSWGYNSATALHSCQPDLLIHNPSELSQVTTTDYWCQWNLKSVHFRD
ncbi:HAD-IA family hydrolase [Halothece sp. PCC 7418]|uniref:HAD-IA family hydrolase n=1 Tax=Halothece sp. (strain PCC 7418) TaxID=65093 RepID=UPI0005A22EA9|nr:HAD-IA family hydrolase [Halothece sp. PCC 7418]